MAKFSPDEEETDSKPTVNAKTDSISKNRQ